MPTGVYTQLAEPANPSRCRSTSRRTPRASGASRARPTAPSCPPTASMPSSTPYRPVLLRPVLLIPGARPALVRGHRRQVATPHRQAAGRAARLAHGRASSPRSRAGPSSTGAPDDRLGPRDGRPQLRGLARSAPAQRRMQQQLTPEPRALSDRSSVADHGRRLPAHGDRRAAARIDLQCAPTSARLPEGRQFGTLVSGCGAAAPGHRTASQARLRRRQRSDARGDAGPAVLNAAGVWVVRGDAAARAHRLAARGSPRPRSTPRATSGARRSPARARSSPTTRRQAPHPITVQPAGQLTLDGRLARRRPAADRRADRVGAEAAGGRHHPRQGPGADRARPAVKLPIGPRRSSTPPGSTQRRSVALSRDGSGMAVDLLRAGRPDASRSARSPARCRVVGGNGSRRHARARHHGAVLRPSVSRTWQTTGINASFLATQQ